MNTYHWSWAAWKEVQSVSLDKARSSHTNPEVDNGVWYCDYCEAESSDRELFEEAGEIENCYKRGLAAGKVPDYNDVMAVAETMRAKKWIEDARKSLQQMGEAGTKATKAFQEFGTKLESIKMIHQNLGEKNV